MLYVCSEIINPENFSIMNINELTASRIKEIRSSKNLSAENIAKELNISKTAYSQLENGHVEITLNRIEALSKILQIPLADFIPNMGSISQIAHGNGSNMNGQTNTVNNFFTSTEDQLQDIADKLNATIAEMKKKK